MVIHSTMTKYDKKIGMKAGHYDGISALADKHKVSKTAILDLVLDFAADKDSLEEYIKTRLRGAWS